MDSLNVAIIQSELFWENKEKNIFLFTQKINNINTPVDVIVLPEMFTTGFTMNPSAFAESVDGATVTWMKQMAALKKCAITGSLITISNNKYFNTLVWVFPNGSVNSYDKRHLFTMGDENNNYSQGNTRIVVEYNGWKICPLICYDLRFPVWSRNTKDNTYDLLIYVANWPQVRSHAWTTLLPARAIENQCYVVGLNRVGVDGNNINHSGDSAIYNFMGQIIEQALPNENKTIVAKLNKNELAKYRNSFPVLNDADVFDFKK